MNSNTQSAILNPLWVPFHYIYIFPPYISGCFRVYLGNLIVIVCYSVETDHLIGSFDAIFQDASNATVKACMQHTSLDHCSICFFMSCLASLDQQTPPRTSPLFVHSRITQPNHRASHLGLLLRFQSGRALPEHLCTAQAIRERWTAMGRGALWFSSLGVGLGTPMSV